MRTEKEFSKNKTIMVAVILLVALALVLAVLLILSGRQQDTPDPQETQASTPNATEGTQPELPTESVPAVTTYTVVFKDHDGTVLDTQKVESGKSAAAPANPSREYFTFAGWDSTFDKVTGDLVVTATYTTNRTVIYAESVTVSKGTDQVTVNIRIMNNPGIMGAVLKVSVDDQVFAFAEGKKTQYPGLTLTAPGSGTTSSPYTFMLDALELTDDDKADGTLFSITFTVKDTTAVGSFQVAVAYDEGAIFDEAYADPQVMLENGTITIE